MSEESFRSGEETGAIGSLLETNEPLTAFFTIEAMDYYSKPCELKFVWKSPEKAISSFAFPKGSPLLPFFKHAYSKIGQSEKNQQKMDEKRDTFELQFKKFNRTINFEQNRLIDCLAYYGNDFCICSIYHRSMYGSNASYKKMQGNHCYHRIERKFLRQTPPKIPSIFTD